ncbi:hypothetical protein BC832DRAFT_539833 [Gaertneriomyces semiglobifer]|nr:hypothetical protein BC832DRAFT_539833 [Gaertneriomyces semiglobifer]
MFAHELLGLVPAAFAVLGGFLRYVVQGLSRRVMGAAGIVTFSSRPSVWAAADDFPVNTLVDLEFVPVPTWGWIWSDVMQPFITGMPETKATEWTKVGHINSSLLAIRSVVSVLKDNKAQVPYRNAKITQLLCDSLEGGSASALAVVYIYCCCFIKNCVKSMRCDGNRRHP